MKKVSNTTTKLKKKIQTIKIPKECRKCEYDDWYCRVYCEVGAKTKHRLASEEE